MTAAATHPDPLALMQSDREQLTHLLRGLAARLDQLDRHLADLVWLGRGTNTGAALAGFASIETHCQRTALEAERSRLSERLTVLAGQLNALDSQLSAAPGSRPLTPTRVGTCPYCGYPSLGSGLCAFCRPHPTH